VLRKIGASGKARCWRLAPAPSEQIQEIDQMGVPTNNKFADKKPAAGAAKKKAKPKGMGGLEAPRNPMPKPGLSRFRLLEVEEGFNEGTNRSSLKLKVVALDLEGSPHSAGDEFTLVFMRTAPGERDYKQAIAGFAGYDDIDEYATFDEHGELFTAAIGEDNDYSEEAAQLIGRVCDAFVSKGGPVKDKDTGEPKIDPETGEPDFFRKYKWTPVADDDDDQDQSPKITK
jgi:hypothetical protein